MKPPANKNKKFYRPNELNEYELFYKTPTGRINTVITVDHSYFVAKKSYELKHPKNKVFDFAIIRKNIA